VLSAAVFTNHSDYISQSFINSYSRKNLTEYENCLYFQKENVYGINFEENILC